VVAHPAVAALVIGAVVLFAFAIAIMSGFASAAITGGIGATDMSVLGVLALIGAAGVYTYDQYYR